MLKVFRLSIIVGLTALLLGSCASRLQSDVVTFHEGRLPKGETIHIESINAFEEESLEFSHYKNLISAELRRIGYVPVKDDQAAELVAQIGYSVSDGQTQIRSSQRNYVRYHFYHGHYHNPFYYGFYNDWPPESYSYIVYNRQLHINISRKSPEPELLFEGRVQSIGREKEIASVMPYMITAMFNNFPGENGVTKVVTIEKK